MTEQTAPALTAEEFAARRLKRRTWHGHLAADTVDQIAERIRRLIGDGQRYTWIANNTAQPHMFPEVRTGQRVEPGKATDRQGLRVTKGDGSVHLTVVDTERVWGIHSHFATEAEAREAAQADTDKATTYVLIEGWGDGTTDRIEIAQFNGYGERLHWVIAPQYQWEEDAIETEASVLDRAAVLVEGTDPAEATTHGEVAQVLREAAKQTRYMWKSQLPEAPKAADQ